jgi:predicted DNA-binding protein YlxM (UPF0122 family)
MYLSGGLLMSKDLKMALLIDLYGAVLTSKQRDMLELYYNEDLSLSEIAENEKITRQGVRDSIKRAEQILCDMEEKVGACARFEKVRGALDKIRCLTEDIEKASLNLKLEKINRNSSEIIGYIKECEEIL